MDQVKSKQVSGKVTSSERGGTSVKDGEMWWRCNRVIGFGDSAFPIIRLLLYISEDFKFDNSNDTESQTSTVCHLHFHGRYSLEEEKKTTPGEPHHLKPNTPEEENGRDC
ncbi:unnamed protein product [Linum tenue]|uniref:Uncharacterized protein n=1 Tax=Linum tenue TaxID=586396 RepID=A0AAV0KJ08_9ROSI|nr:unnamed protein product [Linum tenue]